MATTYGWACDELRECIGGHDKLAPAFTSSPTRAVLAWLLGPSPGDTEFCGRWSGRVVRCVDDGSFDWDRQEGWTDVELETLMDMKAYLEIGEERWEELGLGKHERELLSWARSVG